jgi:small basic protein (TIGR04137 family)
MTSALGRPQVPRQAAHQRNDEIRRQLVDFSGQSAINPRPPRYGGRNRSPNMSMHPSLKSASKITAKRNVLKRFERIDIMRKNGKWKEGDRAHGLPKTKQSA